MSNETDEATGKSIHTMAGFKNQSFAHFDRRIAIAFGALLFTLLVTALLAGGFYYRSVAVREQDKLSTLISQILAKSVNRISFSGKYHARLLLAEIIQTAPGIRYIVLADTQGHVLAHSDPSRNDTQLDADALAAAGLVLAGQDKVVRNLIIHGEAVRDITVAYLSGFDNRISGVIQVGLSDQMQRAALKQGLIFVAGLVVLLLLIGFVVTRHISRVFARPVVRLANDLSATLQAIPDMLFELDREGRFIKIVTNQGAWLVAGEAQLLGHTVREMMPTQAADNVMRALAQADEKGAACGLEIFLPHAGGDHCFELSVAKKQGVRDELPKFIMLSRDITERKKAQDEVNTLAFYDPLTQLPNRRLLHDRLTQALATIARSERHGALLFIDLDNFKVLNDDRGHPVGDMLLKQVAQRLGDCVRVGDTVARLGGDVFVVILEDLSENIEIAATQAETVTRNILTSLRQTYQLDSHVHHCTASIGITLFSNQLVSIDDLLKQADLAMYQSKAAGRNTLTFFDQEMQAVATARAGMETDLRDALLKGEFLLYYQAQVADEGRLTGAEVLLRWQHPERGLVSPLTFIGLAEDTGLILPLGRWVLETACRQLAAWADHPEMAHLTVAVNVSARQLRAADFVQEVLATLAHTGANPNRLKLELTESLLVHDVEDTIARMTLLKEKGVGFSLDDFGTGYSSLSYLKRLPLNQLKIDQSFVKNILTEPNDAAIAEMVIFLGKALGLAVIAEGVETPAQRDFLAAQGCHAFQGYLFSRPLPLDAFEMFALQLPKINILKCL